MNYNYDLEKMLSVRELYYVLEWEKEQIIQFNICTRDELERYLKISDEVNLYKCKGDEFDCKLSESRKNALK